MATNFPSSLDTSTTIPAEGASTPLSTNHVTAHQNIQDAIEAIEAKVGADSSAVTTSHDYKLSEVTSTDKAVGKTATQTLTNKTLTSPTITGATITTSSVNGVTLQTAGLATDFLAANGTYQAGGVANASTTVKGIVEAATSSEVTFGTATGGTGAILVVTPDALAASSPTFDGTNLTNVARGLYKNGTTTYDLATASGNQTIAHGLGIAPKFIRITYHSDSTNATPWITWGSGVYNGTTNSTTYMIASETMAFQSASANSTNIIDITTNNAGLKQTATATYDATNITLAWTRTGSTPGGTAYLMWEAYA